MTEWNKEINELPIVTTIFQTGTLQVFTIGVCTVCIYSTLCGPQLCVTAGLIDRDQKEGEKQNWAKHAGPVTEIMEWNVKETSL